MPEQTTVTYSLEEVLTRLEKNIDKQFDEVKQQNKETNQKIERLEKNIDKQFDEIKQQNKETNQKIERLLEIIVELKVGQARLESNVEGLSKRIDSQEFVSRGILLALLATILGGAAKMFGLIGHI